MKGCFYQPSDIPHENMALKEMFKKVLEKLHFNSDNGLVLCKDPKYKHIGELYHIHEKADKLGATAVLFRRKYNENNEITDSKPALYIYKEKDDFFNSQPHKDLHAKIWSAGDIEVYFIVSETRIDIFNARKPADVTDKNDLSLKSLCLVSEALEKFNDQRFSAIVFGKGIFWEQEDFSNQLKEEDSPFHRLLEYLMIVRKDLEDNKSIGLSRETIDKLLIICILIKFLEGIKDVNEKHALSEIYDRHDVKSKKFEEALEKGLCIPILKELACKFKGKIFDISAKERQEIEKAKLKSVAAFLTAKLDITKEHKQRFLWEQYNFNHLPVELISSIYENFLQKEEDIREKGVVYTPPFLVNFLIDEVMPLNKTAASEYFYERKFKVLDPSCGSGVFLVAAYKRMLQWWSINCYEKTGEIKFPDLKVCQEILENNIFGVDIEKTATLITIFSLTIALLDKLEPKKIWNNLKLNSLQNNIKTQDFFEWAANAKSEGKKFDLVIGNPPFNDEKGESSHKIEPELVKKIGFKHEKVAGNKFALQFFEGGMALGKEVILIIPSSVLLYNRKAQTYREQIFKDFTIEKIFDFTHLRRELFGSSDTPVCAVLANPTESDGKAIEHTVVKRLVHSENKICFEIDHYDRHFVRHDWTTDAAKQFIWKTNLLGGGRLFHLIYRLSLLETLKQFIDRKKNSEWIYSVGYIIKDISNKRKLRADFITGKLTINPKSFKYNGDFDTEIENSELFVAPRKKELYTAPHIIFKLVAEKSKIPMAFSDEYLCFNSKFVGIHAPQSDREELYRIYDRLHKNETTFKLYQTFILATSSSAMIHRETSMVKEDIDNLPYPEETEYLIPSPTEEILINDILEYYIHLGKAISKKGKGLKLNKKVSKDQLQNFGKTFCDLLNPIYAKNGKSWQCGKFYQTESFTIYQFGYGKNECLSFQMPDDLYDVVKSMIYDNTSNRGAIFTRVCRYYKHLNGYDCVFLIKPNATRYWLNSIALRDADETFMDLRKAGR